MGKVQIVNDYKRIIDDSKTYPADGITFIIMKPSLHAHDRHTFEQTKNQLTYMTRDGRDRKIWDGVVWEAFLVSQRFCQ